MTMRLIGVLQTKTGLAFAAVDAVLQLEKSFFAVGIDVVRDRRTSERDRFLQNFFEELVQFLQLIARDRWKRGRAGECLRETGIRRHRYFRRHAAASDSAGRF